MNEMMSYIFGSMQDSEAAIKQINKMLKKQKAFNRRVTFCGVLVTMLFILQELDKKKGE